MSNKNENKSLFLYTALIFFVAIVLIILSFFGQTNLQKSQPQIETETEQSLSGISEKAAILSEENKTLLEQNKQLAAEIEELKSENEALVQKQEMNDTLLSAYGYYYIGNDEKALELLEKVSYDELSTDQRIIYDKLNKNLK